MNKKFKNIFFIFFFWLILPTLSVAESQKAPYSGASESLSHNKSIAIQPRLYKLRAKLKIKNTAEDAYWDEKQKIDWEKEFKNWKCGLLDSDNLMPPLIFYRENFIIEETKDFYWLHDGAGLLIVNPLNKDCSINLTFFANSIKKNQDLFIYVNGRLKKKIIIPRIALDSISSMALSKLMIENISLSPGNNEIKFFSSEKSALKSFRFENNPNLSKNLFVKFKNNIRAEVISLKPAARINEPIFSYEASDDLLSFLIYRNSSENNNFFLVSREFNIDLEEYPFLNFAYGNEGFDVSISLGIDFDNDGKVDDYLNLESSTDVNLLELARSKWKNDENSFYPHFILKQIFFVCQDKIHGDPKANQKAANKLNDFSSLNLYDFNFYSDKSIALLLKRYAVSALEVDPINCSGFKSFNEKECLIINAYFRSNKEFQKSDNVITEEFISSNYKEKVLKNKDETKSFPEYFEVSLPVVIPGHNNSRNTYLSFCYRLSDFSFQEIKVYLELVSNSGRNNNERILVPKDNFEIYPVDSGFKKVLINLSRSYSDIYSIKRIIFQVNKSDHMDKDGWYSFYIRDSMEFFKKYPAIVKSSQLKEDLLSDLMQMDLPLLNIDKDQLRFSQIKNLSWRIFENEIADFGNFKPEKGNHEIDLLDNNAFKVEWVSMEPEEVMKEKLLVSEPKIIFRKVNQVKYIVQIRGATSPFWLVFLEGFHPQWKIFLEKEKKLDNFEIVKDYNELGVKEIRHSLQTEPFNFKYLFAKPLGAEHFLVNLYSNGWYIDPHRLNLPQDFTLVLYFWPQYLFNIGLIISGSTLCFCLFYFIVCIFIKRKK